MITVNDALNNFSPYFVLMLFISNNGIFIEMIDYFNKIISVCNSKVTCRRCMSRISFRRYCPNVINPTASEVIGQSFYENFVCVTKFYPESWPNSIMQIQSVGERCFSFAKP